MASKYKKSSIAIIIPMYNEEASASKCVDKVVKELKKVKNYTKLLAVNDGSTDKTLQILREKKKKYKSKIEIITYSKNRGYGFALNRGIKKALDKGFEFYITMDSDLTNDPKYIHDFIRAMSDKIDCVKASRYITDGKVINVPLFRRVVSIIGNGLAGMFLNLGIKDYTNGFKMVRLNLLKGVSFKENNFSIILEEIYYLKKKGARFTEIPNTLTVRENSKSHFRYTPKTYYDYFKYLILSLFT
jgi:dolichol-phosphate mannosyltransferase